MTIHKSLTSGDKFAGKRNVLKRSERIAKMEKDAKLKEGDSVFGLPKLKIVKLKHRKKSEVKAAEEAAAAKAEGEATDAAAPPPEEKK